VTAIAGLWRFDGKPDAGSGCDQMLSAQQLYGPDDCHAWADGSIALGCRLYRLLPEDKFDRQPVFGCDGRFALVADVRLDNRADLISELRLPFDVARRLSDSAVLLESLARWGEGCLDRLVGEFGCALWDKAGQKLTLARDFLGRRPLHYHCGKDFFAFATMPKGLHALPEIPNAPDEQAVAEMTALLPGAEAASLFKGIERVDPGCVVTVTRDGIRTRRWWEPRRHSGNRLRSQDYAEGLRHHLDEAVRAQVRSTNKLVGSHLSSGWDSAAVTATAAGLLAPSGGRVVAFTSVPRQGYDGRSPRRRLGDEGPLAAATAATYPNIDHVLVRSMHSSSLDELDRDFFFLESPLLDPCYGVWSRAICRAAGERDINVVLIGQLGNFTVSYSGFEALADLLCAGRVLEFGRHVGRLLANGHWRGVAAHALGPFMPGELWQWAHERFKGNRWNILDYTGLRAERLAALDYLRLARERSLDPAFRPWSDSYAMRLWALRRVDFSCYYKGLLAEEGVDHRDPTADKRLVEFCLALPTEEWLADGIPRGLARRALADRLPAAVLANPYKGYQAVDWHEGLTTARQSGALMAELERIEACKPAAGLLDIPRLKRLVEYWPNGGWQKPEVMLRYRTALLRSISVGHFLRKATRGNA
jgi:asparagine synthase (glutamine-hydrolysing)